MPATRFDEEYSAAFAELRDELKTTYAGLDYTIRLKRFTVGQSTAHIDVMEKALQHRRSAKKQPEPPPAR